jgi:hypothetical protein
VLDHGSGKLGGSGSRLSEDTRSRSWRERSWSLPLSRRDKVNITQGHTLHFLRWHSIQATGVILFGLPLGDPAAAAPFFFAGDESACKSAGFCFGIIALILAFFVERLNDAVESFLLPCGINDGCSMVGAADEDSKAMALATLAECS